MFFKLTVNCSTTSTIAFLDLSCQVMVALLMPLRGDDDDGNEDDDDEDYDDDDDGDGGQLVVNQIRPVQRVPIKCLWATKGVLARTFIFINVIIIINIIIIL